MYIAPIQAVQQENKDQLLYLIKLIKWVCNKGTGTCGSNHSSGGNSRLVLEIIKLLLGKWY